MFNKILTPVEETTVEHLVTEMKELKAELARAYQMRDYYKDKVNKLRGLLRIEKQTVKDYITLVQGMRVEIRGLEHTIAKHEAGFTFTQTVWIVATFVAATVFLLV
jgi:hypothetical protein